MPLTRRKYLGALGVSALAGCTGTGPTAEASSGSTEVSLLLNWKPNGLHVPYYTAKARRYYEEAGLSVSSIDPGEGSEFSAKQAGLGNNAFAISSSDQVLNINSRDLSPLAVGVVMQKSPVVVFTTPETFGEEFTSVDQLAGKQVGTGPGMVRIMTELLLERHGLLSEVELVDTGFDTVQQLLTGKVDAAGGVFGDAIAARAQGNTVQSIPVAETVDSYGHVITTNREFARSNPDAVRSFLEATARGAAWAQQNPDQGVDHLVDANQVLGESRDQQLENWETMASQFMLSQTVEETGWGWSRPNPWETAATALADAGLLGGEVDPATVWTNEYLDTDAEYIGSYTDVISE
ncbi:MAG: NitT/TauT family transport system substrate-binding protein [Haloarculaceae archaeon]|jgi:NitT/TauT family transport system substrate-binding protein